MSATDSKTMKQDVSETVKSSEDLKSSGLRTIPIPQKGFTPFREDWKGRNLPDLFAERVRDFTQRTAIETDSKRISYDQLDRLSNRIAETLLSIRKRGREPIAFLAAGEGITFTHEWTILYSGSYIIQAIADPPEGLI